MTILALNAAPLIAIATPKMRAIRRWIERAMEQIAESRMRKVQRELERHGFTVADKSRSDSRIGRVR